MICNHQDDELTYYFSYHNLFHICKMITKETSKLEQTVFIFKNTTFSNESKNKNLEKELRNLRERQNNPVQNYSTSNEEDEPDKYNECDTLKNEICDLNYFFLSILPKEETS